MEKAQPIEKKRKNGSKTALIIAIVILSIAVIVVVIVILVLVYRNNLRRKNAAFPHLPIIMDDIEIRKLDKRFKNDGRVVNPTIFVAISSYRDPELCFTLQDLFDKAYNPSRVFVGVVEQNDNSDSATCHTINAINDTKIKSRENIRFQTLHYTLAKGPTHARAICESLWKGEEYYMMTDSHMRFEPGWDVELLNMLFKCRRPKRTAITMYPEGYERYQDRKGNVNNRILMRRGWRYEQLKKFNAEGMVEFEVNSMLFNYLLLLRVSVPFCQFQKLLNMFPCMQPALYLDILIFFDWFHSTPTHLISSSEKNFSWERDYSLTVLI